VTDIALIPPASLIECCNGRPYQMMLPSFIGVKAYRDFYDPYNRLDGFYIIDNGEYEREPLSAKAFLDLAFTFRMNEMVAPDTIGDSKQSIKQLRSFLKEWSKYDWGSRSLIQIMAVVQGRTEEECRQHLLTIDREYSVSTIGLPKHLPTTTGDEDIRVKLAGWITNAFPNRYNIHFLGLTTVEEAEWAWHVGIRSLDTTAPFVCAADRQILTYNEEAPPRQNWYQNLPGALFSPSLVKSNINFLDSRTK
jgi:hypothetical protein